MFEADTFYGDWGMDHRPPEYNYPQRPIGHMPTVDAMKQLTCEGDPTRHPNTHAHPNTVTQPGQGPCFGACVRRPGLHTPGARNLG